MGPRTKRRLAAGAISLGVVAAIVVGVLLLTRSRDHTGSVSPAAAATSWNTPHLVFGMSREQVERLTGPPTTVRGNCWTFKAKAGKVGGLPTRTVGSLTLAQPGSIASRSIDFIKECFLSGALAQTFTHSTKTPYEKAGWYPPS